MFNVGDIVKIKPGREGFVAPHAMSEPVVVRAVYGNTFDCEGCPPGQCYTHSYCNHELVDKRVSTAVNHPTHYNSHPSGVECITVVEHMTFNVGNAIKYLWRAGLKDSNPSLQDLEKAAWYINREIEKTRKDME